MYIVNIVRLVHLLGEFAPSLGLLWPVLIQLLIGPFAARARRVRRRSPAAAAKPGTFAHLQRWESIEFLQPDRLFSSLTFMGFKFLLFTRKVTNLRSDFWEYRSPGSVWHLCRFLDPEKGLIIPYGGGAPGWMGDSTIGALYPVLSGLFGAKDLNATPFAEWSNLCDSWNAVPASSCCMQYRDRCGQGNRDHATKVSHS